MQFIDLVAQQKRIRDRIEANIAVVLDHGQYIMGPEIKILEEKLAGYVGVKHASACASGTDALLMALMAYGIGPGDAIITTPFTFIATGEVISLLGATPVFVDIDPQSFNLDPARLEQAVEAISENAERDHPLPRSEGSLNAKGIIAVDLFGLPADYDSINVIARHNDLFVLEDAAQSFGAEYKGSLAGNLADIGCTSFFPAKPLGCYGDGGMCFTNDDKLAETMNSLRVHGKGILKYDIVRTGINGRLDTLQAAILLAKFDIFPEEIELRQQVAARYTLLLNQQAEVQTPIVHDQIKSAWAQYSVLAKDEDHRSRLQARLKTADIPTAIYYAKPLHLQDAFALLGYRQGDFPVSENLAARIFSLPMHPYLSSADQDKITKVLSSS
ncbi:MAG: DegT/DnrJ/EryC1/StrS family aminotransferase [Desulfobacterales bacterium]|jgi:dTDP-4-amino-4,6-dideoxygalactose transaminase